MELTYKKRYTESGYQAMLKAKDTQLFEHFSPSIDLGYSKTTYSFSCVRTFAALNPLEVLEARRLAILNCPPALMDWGGKNKGFCHLCGSVLMGPVLADIYRGSFEGYDIKIEVWPLNGYLTGLSFEIETEKSESAKKKVIEALIKEKLLLKVDTLKTDALLDFYTHSKKR